MSADTIDQKGVIVDCPSCGTRSRVPFSRIKHRGKCPDCGASIPPPGRPVDVKSMADFDALVGSASVPVIVDFWAPWCGPCRAVAPEFEAVASRNAGRMLVAKVNTETQPDLGIRYQIRSIPTMAVFLNGREAARTAGARPAAAIEAFVNEALASAQ